MTRSFFRALERGRVRYLLISGQAAILYGAATFSEDIDLWVDPDPANWGRFLRALASLKATVYKLTPPLTGRFLRRGHGFHFLIPAGMFLDVMGVPPRVGRFAQARRRSRRLGTDWGVLPVVSPEDLVLIKRTNRPADYDVISNLVRRRVAEDGSPEVMRWALETTFKVEDLADLTKRATGRLRSWPRRPALRALLPAVRGEKPISEDAMDRGAALLAEEMNRHLIAGRRYWTPVVRELRELRASRRLVPEGTPVRSLLPAMRGGSRSRGGRR